MGKRKIAICFYGQPRLVERGYEKFKTFIDRYEGSYDFDFYVHTWWDLCLVGKKFSISPWRKVPEEELIIREDSISKIEKFYSPKRLAFHPPQTFEDVIESMKETRIYQNSGEITRNNLKNFLSNLFSKSSVCDLIPKENLEDYDIFISSRFDISKEISLELENLEKGKIYSNYTNDCSRFYLVDEFIVFTDPELFVNYSKTFKNINSISSNDQVFERAKSLGVGFNLNLEELITLNLLATSASEIKNEELKNLVTFKFNITAT